VGWATPAGGDVDLAGLAAVGQQVRDQLDIVLHQLHPVRLAHLPEALDLALGLDQGVLFSDVESSVLPTPAPVLPV
jgi:hypothetical protein